MDACPPTEGMHQDGKGYKSELQWWDANSCCAEGTDLWGRCALVSLGKCTLNVQRTMEPCSLSEFKIGRLRVGRTY